MGQLAAMCPSRCGIEGCVHCAKIQSCALMISSFFLVYLIDSCEKVYIKKRRRGEIRKQQDSTVPFGPS